MFMAESGVQTLAVTVVFETYFIYSTAAAVISA